MACRSAFAAEMRRLALIGVSLVYAPTRDALAQPNPAQPANSSSSIRVGTAHFVVSCHLAEPRRINVYAARRYSTDTLAALPVLYMPDGGIGEDFLHLAGLINISVA